MISLLNKLGRRMVSDRGERLNNPRLFSSTAKRVLSVLFLLILGFSFLPTFDIDVSAAASGISNVKYEVLENGSIKVTATVTPNVINGSVGSARLDALMMTELSSGYYDCMPAASSTRISGSDRTVSVWENIYWGFEDGTYTARVRKYDGTTGSATYPEHEELVTLTGVKYNRDGKTPPSISNIKTTPNPNDKTKVNFQFNLWHTRSRKTTNVSYYRGDENGENGTLVYSRNITNNPWTLYYEYTGLTPGTTYTFWCTASSAAGTSTSAKYVMTPGTPSAPTNFRGIPGNGTVTYTWGTPTNPNGATIVGYNFYRYAGSTTPMNGTTPITGMSYTLNGTNGHDILAAQAMFVAAVTSEGKEGARAEATGSVRVGSPQPVANACCIMLNS